MLKIRWEIQDGKEEEFRANQEALCAVMLEHPGVITYHAEYPEPGVSEWTEVYANDDAFAAHLADDKGKGPLGALIEASAKITCRCFGSPSDASKEILVGFGTTYHETGTSAFVLHPEADTNSPR